MFPLKKDKDKNIRFKKIGAKDLPKTIEYLLEEQGVKELEKPWCTIIKLIYSPCFNICIPL